MVNMRVEWFLWVSKTRKKLQRSLKKPVSHRQAMKAAALTWPKEKTKILNRIKREERKAIREAHKTAKPPPVKAPEPAS